MNMSRDQMVNSRVGDDVEELSEEQMERSDEQFIEDYDSWGEKCVLECGKWVF